ncbi:hypothetical protein MNV84_01632 [Leishmania braziliensis]|nr:hypothetical protein MNV84_01632 [Leishmania braziliensis]
MMSDMASWSCVIIKFERSRENERWHTLLSGLKEAQAWHEYAKALPNPDTLNMFLSRFFFQNMRLDNFSDVLIKLVRKQLRELPSKKFPRDLGGELILDDFLIGTQIPWISNVSEPRVSANGEVGFDFNLVYKGGEGGFSLFFRLALTYCGIHIPHIVFSVKLLELETTMHVSIGPPPSKKFWIGAHKLPIVRLEVHQGCASGRGVLHRILTALPNLSGIVTNLIKLYLFSDMVLPYMDDFPLPSVVKSPKASFADLRVRAFDWQRAAKISGAPQCGTPTRSASSNHGRAEGKTTQRNPEQQGSSKHEGRRSMESFSSGSVAMALPPAFGSGASKDTMSVESSTTSRKVTLVDSSLSRSQNVGPGAKTPSPASGGGGGDCDAGFSSGSFCPNASIDVGLPVELPSPRSTVAPQAVRGGPAGRPRQPAADGGGDRTRFPATHASHQVGSYSASMPGTPVSTSAPNDSFFCNHSAFKNESDGDLSSVSAKRSGTSDAMRSLKNLLKVKGKDMTRESVSRSKKKS